MGLGRLAILAIINVLLLIVGCFLDPLSAIVMLMPLLIPVVKAAGIDTVHFGLIVTLNLAIGMFHPPFGINIFVAQAVLKFPLNTIIRGLWPFIALCLFALVLVTYVPEISLFGVRLFFPQ
jgi:C4-dicarboxylate transporter DctM subunit